MKSLTSLSIKGSTTSFFPKIPPGFPSTGNCCSIFRNGHFFFGQISSQKLLRRSLMVEAKKGNEKKNKNNKVDNHSFVPKPDESTGFFPESVLLKEKKVQEDGRVLPEFADDEEEELFEFLNLQLESDLNVDENFLREKKGRVWRFSDWGMRRLAYKIKKATHAHYILMNFELGAQWINDFKSMLDQDERVIRHLVMKRDEAITEDCPPPPEFHTLRADMTDEYEVDDMDDDDDYAGDDGEEWYDEDERDLEGYEDDDVDVEDVSSRNAVRGREPTNNCK